MLDLERRRKMLSLIEQRGGASVAELSSRFGISPATVRRDLAQLSRQGLVERAHGGAIPRRARQVHGLPEPPILQRAALQAEEKQRIGRAAAGFVADGDVIMIAGGTTTAAMLPHLAERQDLTVITNSLRIATLLAAYEQINTIVLGGQIRHRELSLVGSLAAAALQDLRADRLFLGSPALHVEHGISSDDLAEAQLDRQLIACAGESILLVDHTKFGKIAMVRVAPMPRIQRVITDKQAPAHDLAALRDQEIPLTLV